MHGDPTKRVRRAKGLGSVDTRGAIMLVIDGRHVFEHVLVAERALGRRMPEGACVHHADGDPSNNSPHNLVICPSQAYHSLIHQRMRAASATGDPNKRKCHRCGAWDDPVNLSIYGGDHAVHPACNRAHAAKHRRSA